MPASSMAPVTRQSTTRGTVHPPVASCSAPKSGGPAAAKR